MLVIYFSVFTRRSRSVFLYLYGVLEGEGDGHEVYSCGDCKEGPYQDRPLLYPFHHFLSLLWSCFSPGSA